jgi:hypothetical protein
MNEVRPHTANISAIQGFSGQLRIGVERQTEGQPNVGAVYQDVRQRSLVSAGRHIRIPAICQAMKVFGDLGGRRAGTALRQYVRGACKAAVAQPQAGDCGATADHIAHEVSTDRFYVPLRAEAWGGQLHLVE